jgi:branched-chain amino acid transport system ATP-binding protein
VSALLAVRNLSKRFGALVVTQDVTFDVQPGELYAVIGPNGAGKTTLIHQLSGMLASDGGEILFDGVDLTSLSMPDRVHAGLARSFQITSILPQFSVLENVAMAVQARSGTSFRFFSRVGCDAKLNDEAIAVLHELELGDRLHERADSLSYGEKRQLALAVALATKPKLLLLDEPLAGTSHEESRKIAAILRAMKGKTAILLVEHDMDAVFSLADRVGVLVYGQLIASGAPNEIRANPAVRAAYLGEETL